MSEKCVKGFRNCEERLYKHTIMTSSVRHDVIPRDRFVSTMADRKGVFYNDTSC